MATTATARNVGLAAIVLGAALYLLLGRGELPDGPEPVAWDHEACAHCRMLVGDRRFAAQLITQAGDVLNFDDPGCLLQYLAKGRPAVHRIWYRHVTEDRWISGERVAFRSVADSPMGHGLGAVDADAPGALPMAKAAEKVSRP